MFALDDTLIHTALSEEYPGCYAQKIHQILINLDDTGFQGLVLLK
jgi:hypothetical protein